MEDTNMLYSQILLDVLKRASLTNDKRLVDEKIFLDQILNKNQSLILNYLMQNGVSNKRLEKARKKFLRKGYSKDFGLDFFKKRRLEKGLKEKAEFDKKEAAEEKATTELKAEATTEDDYSPIPFEIEVEEEISMVIYLQPELFALLNYAEEQLKDLNVCLMQLEFVEIFLITRDIDPIADFLRNLDIPINLIVGEFEDEYIMIEKTVLEAYKTLKQQADSKLVDPEASDTEKQEMLENSIEAEQEEDLLGTSQSIPQNVNLNTQNNENNTAKATEPKKGNSLTTLPAPLQSCIKDITVEMANKGNKCDILGRDNTVEDIITILRKHKKRNVILIGKPGVGKTAIIDLLAYNINTGKVPDELKKCHILLLDVNALLAGTAYRGMAERRFTMINEYLEKNPDAILFIDEIHTMLGAGRTEGSTQDLSNSLKPILAKGVARVIGATTKEEYDRYFSTDKAMKRRFEVIEVKEPRFDKVPAMIKSRVEVLSQYHNVKIEKDVINYAIFISSCFRSETCNPDRSIDVIDSAMIKASDSKSQVVTRQNVLDVFKKDMKNYGKMEDKDRRSIAYHEMGHYLVSLRTGNKRYKNVLAVSIIPAGDYSGVTVYDDNDEEMSIPNKKELIEEIEIDLGGRFSEQLFTNEMSCGASEDLRQANYIAKILVSKFGLVNVGDNNVNMTFDKDTKSELVTNEMNKEISKVMEEAERNTKGIINSNKELIGVLVDNIMKQQIMDGEALLKIVEDYDKKHNS